ncbi:unnamed protein product [Calicophoron daubneyi]|uniref:Uncharacterized protein n=1 Tax=Calicophoron daubneyi TaxID=300641 RepID=A0AAV2TD04_CALDB
MTSTALVVLIILAYFKHSPPVVSVSVPGSEDWFLVRPLDLFIPANGDMQRFLRFTLPAQIRSLLSDPVALLRPAAIGCIRMYPGDELGRGAGKGGGKGGKIRDAGGSFGKRQAGQEEEYFYRKDKEQLEALKKHLEEEVQYRKDEIKQHQEAIKRHQKLLEELEKQGE